MIRSSTVISCAAAVALLFGCTALVSPAGAAVDETVLFPKIACATFTPANNRLIVRFGANNQSQNEIVDPAVNQFVPNKIQHPTVFPPGNTWDIFNPPYDVSTQPTVSWTLGDPTHVVVLKYPYTEQTLSTEPLAPTIPVPLCPGTP